VNVFVEIEDHERIKAAARVKGVSVSGYIRMATLALLAKEKR
jgi:hypothetical protein